MNRWIYPLLIFLAALANVAVALPTGPSWITLVGFGGCLFMCGFAMRTSMDMP